MRRFIAPRCPNRDVLFHCKGRRLAPHTQGSRLGRYLDEASVMCGGHSCAVADDCARFGWRRSNMERGWFPSPATISHA
jgi:hypothetical protein